MYYSDIPIILMYLGMTKMADNNVLELSTCMFYYNNQTWRERRLKLESGKP